MIILGIETSTSFGSIALFDSDENLVLGQLAVDIRAAHSEKLVPYIDFLLSESRTQKEDINLVAVSRGPGSFTGLRVGVSTAKGFALALCVPVVGIDSLMTCAFPYLAEGNRVAALFDAKRGEVFGAVYGESEYGIPHTIMEPKIFKINDFIDNCIIQNVSLYTGDIYRDSIMRFLPPQAPRVEAGFERPNAISTAVIGHRKYADSGEDNLSDLSPEYLRNFIPGKPRC